VLIYTKCQDRQGERRKVFPLAHWVDPSSLQRSDPRRLERAPHTILVLASITRFELTKLGMPG